MTSPRLAVYMKDNILNRLLERAFDARQAAIDAKRLDLANQVYDRTYTPEEKKLFKKIPMEFLKTDDDRQVKFGGDFVRVNWGEYRPISKERNNTLLVPATDPLCDLYREIKGEEERLNEERAQAAREARAKLNASSTVQALIAAWPEIKPFAESYLKVKKPQPLVVQNDHLNARFGLPVEEKPPAAKVVKKVKKVKQPPVPMAVLKRVAKRRGKA